ncbi:uncharacterized protein EI97DRAFT_456617 [Westerdykella ornata]|uniref:Uncharacterized protein n=1 Tax=Westerdykella ornata TaxID=318751 RepID=A0A6A6JT60_WESOR|nr:uncharacterized protein EI97DRAFT_456617 [Westerdykella ornata]KAF2278179.1 hypothetical protein EI97DRAFT_456617 [Westerdykella ornata]
MSRLRDLSDGLELEALLFSQFTVPPLQWMADRAPAFAAPRPRVISPFEKLPAEVRHQIYGYLGFPAGRKLWLKCSETCCDDPSHAKPFISSWSPKHNGYEHRVVLTNMIFERPDGQYDRIELEDNAAMARRRARECTWEECGDSPATTYCTSAIFEEVKLTWGLLDVCKSIRAETLDLLFGQAKIRFDYELSDKAVHYDNYKNWAANKSGTGQYFHMRLNPGWFSQMTQVHLSDSVGQGFWARRPGMPWNTSRPSVVENCTSLEELVIPRGVREWHIRPNGRRYFGEQWDGRDEPFDYYADRGSESLQVLELKDVPSLLREEATKNWLKAVLRDLVVGPSYDIRIHDFSEP